MLKGSALRAGTPEGRTGWGKSGRDTRLQSRNNKKLFFAILNKVKNLFLHQSYLKSPLPVKLT